MEKLDTRAVFSRVCYYGQPLSLGLTLSAVGGFMSYMMLLAFKPEEHWALSLATILMGTGFFALFALGVGMLLTPFHKIHLDREELRLQLGGLVLRRIPVKDIRSVTAKTREIVLRSRDVNLHRMTIHCNGSWPNNRSLWVDWEPETEAALREQLVNVNFLF